MSINYSLMKATCLVAILALGFSSCKKKDKSTDSGSSNASTTEVSGEINTDTHWTADQHPLLKGFVYVTAGHTLTIDAGTIVKGDKITKGTLIVEPGAKLIAIGTAAKPIIFTSNLDAGLRNYGDWGGVILCGSAKNNWQAAPYNDGGTHSGSIPVGQGQVEGGPRTIYGGNDDADNSGTLQYVRIEFGGIAFSPNNEVNGLTLCSVGTGTTIDHIQVSWSGDDAIEWFGGSVNTKYIIAHRAWDDDFDTDNGFHGNMQYGIIYRAPFAADQSGSHSLESDSRNEDAIATPLTTPVFTNITLVGPFSDTSKSAVGTNCSGNFVCGEVVRRSSSLSLINSIMIGYPLGVIVDEDPAKGSTVSNIVSGGLEFKSNAVVGLGGGTNGATGRKSVVVSRLNDPHSAPNSTSNTLSDSAAADVNWSTATGPLTWFAANNSYGTSEGKSSKLTAPFNELALDVTPGTGSKVLSGWSPNTSDSKITGSFFDAATFIGAVGTTNWATGWTNFNPQAADYGSAY